jgi:TonB family protein
MSMKIVSSKKTLPADLMALALSLFIHAGLVLALTFYPLSVRPSKAHKEPVFVDVVDVPPAPDKKAEEPEKIKRYSHTSRKVEKETAVLPGTVRPGTVRSGTIRSGTEKAYKGEKKTPQVITKKLVPVEKPEALKGPDKAAGAPVPKVSEKLPETVEKYEGEGVTEPVVTGQKETRPAKPADDVSRTVTDREGPGAAPHTNVTGEPSEPKLFPTDERLRELAKKYYEEEPELEKGKVLTLNTSELKFSKYLLNLKRRIEFFWDYPRSSVRKGEQGKLRINFSISKDGSVEVIDVVKSSNYPALDDAAVTAIRLASPFNAFPEDFRTDKINIRARFEYSIIVSGERR